MRTDYFTKVENRYIFNLSLIFWHMFILLGTLVIIGSIVLLAYSLSPTFKETVDKAIYPPEVEVKLTDLDLSDPAVQQPVDGADITRDDVTPQTYAPVQNELSMVGYKEYLAAIEALKLLIPPSSFEWDTKYSYVILDQRNWDFTRDERYRKRVAIGNGIQGWIDETMEKIKTGSYQERADLLTQYASILTHVEDPALRNSFLYSLMMTTRDLNSYSSAHDALGLMTQAAKVMPLNQLGHGTTPLQDLHNFCQGIENPTAFVAMVVKHLKPFNSDQQIAAFYAMRNNYRLFNDATVQTALTEKYLALMARVTPSKQAEGLDQYYNVHVQKNVERNQEIAKIDSDYASATSSAEAKYRSKEEKKEGYQMKSLMGIAGGIAFISVLAILLVFLSIQRSVRKIEEKVDAKEINA